MRRPAAVLLAVALLSTACASAPVPDDPVVLRMVMADDWVTAPAVGEVITEFERERDVQVVLDGSPFSQIPDVVASAIDRGEPHDVAHWHAFAAAGADLAEPLDAQWDRHGLAASDFLPGAVEDVTWEDHVYGMPLDVNALVLMVNRQQLAAADVAVADLATIEGFRRATSQIMSDGESQHAVSVSASSWAAYGWIVAHGGELVSILGDTPTFTFDDPRTVEALELLVGLVEEGSAPPPVAPDLSLDAVADFMTGDVAMYASGSWDLPTTRRQLHTDRQSPEIGVVALPQRDPTSPRTVLGGSSLFVPQGAEHPELAFELMLALTELDVSVGLAATEGRLPARRAVYDDPLFASSPDLAQFVAQLPTAEVMPLIAYPEVSAAFRDGLAEALSGRQAPAEAMRDVQAFAERWLEES